MVLFCISLSLLIFKSSSIPISIEYDGNSVDVSTDDDIEDVLCSNNASFEVYLISMMSLISSSNFLLLRLDELDDDILCLLFD